MLPVVGVDLAASLAWFLASGLTPLGFAAEAPTGSAGNLHHKIDVVTRDDLVIAIILACAHLQPKRALAMLSCAEAEYRSGERRAKVNT